jgi:hypothetical protein
MVRCSISQRHSFFGPAQAALLRIQRTSHLLYGVAALLTLAARVMARVSFPAFCAVPEYVFRLKTGMWRSRCVPIICVRSSALLFFLYFFISSETKLSGAYDWINKSQYVSKTVKARFRNSFPTP